MRHLLLGGIAALLTLLAFHLIDSQDFRHRMSMASAYSALAVIAVSLLLGPWNVLRNRPNPVSFDLRRDIGIWAGLLALFHTGFGLTVHLRGRMWMYFFKSLHPLTLQNTRFGFANYTGLVAALLFLMLLVISNDISLRSLGVSYWKRLQQLSYLAFILTVIHGIAFQLVEHRRAPWLVAFWLIVIVAVAAQLAGFVRTRSTPQARSVAGAP